MATVYPVVILPSGATSVPQLADTLVMANISGLQNLTFTGDTSTHLITAPQTINPGSEDPGSSFQIIGAAGSTSGSGNPAGSGGFVGIYGGNGGNGTAVGGENGGSGGLVEMVGGPAGVDGGAGGGPGGYVVIDAGVGTGGNPHGEILMGTANGGGRAASAIRIGRSGITTTITGGLSQLTGAVALTANAASSFTTSAGALTLTSAAAATWSTTAGALTLTSAAAATWKTSAGLLTLEGAAGVQINGAAGASYLTFGVTANGIIIQTGRTLAATGTGNINLPNNASARFNIQGLAVGSSVTAANLNAVTNGTLIGNQNEAGSQHNHRSNYVINSWSRANVAANLANVALEPFNDAAMGAYAYRPVYRGDIIGMTVSFSAAIVAGEFQAEIYVDGVASGQTINLTSTDGSGRVTSFTVGSLSYTPGQAIDVRISTDAPWSPTTNDVVVGLLFSEYIT